MLPWPGMNLLMLILIGLGLWVGVTVCYFAWRLMPDESRPFTDPKPPAETDAAPTGDD